jgi:hypothetical protein
MWGRQMGWQKEAGHGSADKKHMPSTDTNTSVPLNLSVFTVNVIIQNQDDKNRFHIPIQTPNDRKTRKHELA